MELKTIGMVIIAIFCIYEVAINEKLNKQLTYYKTKANSQQEICNHLQTNFDSQYKTTEEQKKYIAALQKAIKEREKEIVSLSTIQVCLVEAVKNLAQDYATVKGFKYWETLRYYCNNKLTRLHQYYILHLFYDNNNKEENDGE